MDDAGVNAVRPVVVANLDVTWICERCTLWSEIRPLKQIVLNVIHDRSKLFLEVENVLTVAAESRWLSSEEVDSIGFCWNDCEFLVDNNDYLAVETRLRLGVYFQRPLERRIASQRVSERKVVILIRSCTSSQLKLS